MIELHFYFLLTSHDDLLENTRLILRCFVSLSTNNYSDYLTKLGQFQNSMVLSKFLLKKLLRSFDTIMECNWYGWVSKLKVVDSKLFPFSFYFLFYFQFILLSIFRTRIRVTRSHCHTPVTSGNMVTSHGTHRKI